MLCALEHRASKYSPKITLSLCVTCMSSSDLEEHMAVLSWKDKQLKNPLSAA